MISSIGFQTLAIHASMIITFAAVVVRRQKREREAAETREMHKAAYDAEIEQVGERVKRQMMAAVAVNAPLQIPLQNKARQRWIPGRKGMSITEAEFKILCGGESGKNKNAPLYKSANGIL
ncbi:MAG: hypothetical protein J1G06_04445 [Oscillospiraceae bacterium]|nr:hypothetical protein [Oscillospiraceae bacterium]